MNIELNEGRKKIFFKYADDERLHTATSTQTSSFVVKMQDSGMWGVSFIVEGNPAVLFTKRGLERTFVRLGSVSDFLYEFGIFEFTVYRLINGQVVESSVQ